LKQLSRCFGYTLIEININLLIGLFLLAGILSTYIFAKRENQFLFNEIELRSNANLALKLISDDLSKAGFMGLMSSEYLRDSQNTTVSPLLREIDDCYDERFMAGGSFPGKGLNGVFRPLLISHVNSQGKMSNTLNCIKEQRIKHNSDIISIKRAFGSELIDRLFTLNRNRIYFAVKNSHAYFYPYTELMTVLNSQNTHFDSLFEYQHHIYFVSEAGGIPELKMVQLTNGIDMSRSLSLVQGVEYIRIILGVDDSEPFDGIADHYLPAESISGSEWNIFSFTDIKIFILVRALEHTPDYYDDKSYQLGDLIIPPFNDHFRRLVVQKSIILSSRISH